MSEPGEITLLLREWNSGSRDALDRLVPFVYPHLHRLASSLLRRGVRDSDYQPTALVNELYLKLIQQRKAEWQDRAHFFVFAAKVLRRILTDHARSVLAHKRNSGMRPVPLDENLPWLNLSSTDMIDVDRSLDELEAIDARKVRLVELCYFLGSTVPEAASLLEISDATAERDLKFVRSWLRTKLTQPKS